MNNLNPSEGLRLVPNLYDYNPKGKAAKKYSKSQK